VRTLHYTPTQPNASKSCATHSARSATHPATRRLAGCPRAPTPQSINSTDTHRTTRHRIPLFSVGASRNQVPRFACRCPGAPTCALPLTPRKQDIQQTVDAPKACRIGTSASLLACPPVLLEACPPQKCGRPQSNTRSHRTGRRLQPPVATPVPPTRRGGTATPPPGRANHHVYDPGGAPATEPRSLSPAPPHTESDAPAPPLAPNASASRSRSLSISSCSGASSSLLGMRLNS